MSKPSFFLLGSHGTIRTDAPEEWLGRVVTDYAFPQSSYGPDDAKPIRGDKFGVDNGYSDVSEILRSQQGTKLYGKLTDVFDALFARSGATSPEIEASQVTRYSIDKHDQVFRRLEQHPGIETEVRQLDWVRRKAYLITGLLVTGKIDFTESSSSISSFSIDTKVPTKEALAVAGLPGVDLPLEGQYKNSQETGREGRVGLTGMRIFAVEYRILRKRRLHNGEQLSNKRLQGERAFGHYDDGEELEMLLEEDVLLEDEIDDGDESVFEV